MAASTQKSHNLFQVYLRLRPPQQGGAAASGERFLAVEKPEAESETPKHITLNPPNDRRRAVEKFAFTQVFEEDATQLDVFHCTGVADLVKGVLAPCGGDGTDALLATLGVTGSGKVGCCEASGQAVADPSPDATRHTRYSDRGPSAA